MRRRAILLSLIMGGVLFGPSSVAEAELEVAGVCVLDLTLTFDSPVGLTQNGGGYTLSGSATACVVNDAGRLTRTAEISGSGSVSVWTCGAAAALGTWNHQWSGTPSGHGPRPFFGSHVFSGTWGAWTLEVVGLSPVATGIGELTVHPSDIGKTVACTGGFRSLRMLGVLAITVV